MKIGFVGLGRMGGNMVKRLLKAGHEIVAFDPRKQAREEAEKSGARAAASLEELADNLPQQRLVWLMVPAGRITGEVIGKMRSLLAEGDTLVDGGNSFYKDSLEHARVLKERGIYFLDAGTSGGIWGLKEGYCLMVGGDEEVFRKAAPVLKDLAPEGGYARVGPNGAGHFVKMVHNGIEYGMLEAYAEGFEIMHSKKDFGLDLRKICEVWRHGSVVRSWLLDLSVDVFSKDPSLSSIRGYVEDTGEGRWSVVEAIENAVPAPAIALSLFRRFLSRQEESFSSKAIAALRGQFGGHEVKKEGE